MDKITSDVRRQQWLDIIQACNASGLTKKAWCEQNGINIKSFYYRYFKLLLTEIPKHQEDTDRTFLEKLEPCSQDLPAGCRKQLN